MNQTYLKIIIGPLWKWGVSLPFEIIGIISAFNPDKTGSFWRVEWFWWIIIGLIIWGLVTPYDAAKKIRELEKEIVEIDASLTTDTEGYLKNNIVYLLIENHENFDLRNCYANLTRLEHKSVHKEEEKRIFGTDYRWLNMLKLINLNRNKLPWPAYDFGVEKVITPGTPERINIAMIENENLVFLFENENSSFGSFQGEYYLEVEVGGYSKNKQIKKIKFCGRLDFNFDFGKYRISLHTKDCKND